MLRTISILMCAGAVQAQTFQTPAGTAVYFDKMEYLAATGPPHIVSIPRLGAVTGPKTIDDLTFFAASGSTLEFGCLSGDWSSLLPGCELALSGAENFSVAFPPTRQFGFDFVEPTGAGITGGCADSGCNAMTCTDTLFDVTLRLGGAIVDEFTFNAANEVAAFVGWSSPHLFDQVDFVDVPGTIDNEHWGDFYVDSQSAWTDLGFALAGLVGEPVLIGTGTLAPSSPDQLDLINARPSASAALLFGLSQLNVPFKGGVLVPQPLLTFPLSTDGSGSVSLPFVLPTGLPVGVSLYFQIWIHDAAASKGFAASNGLKGVTP